ncbi:MAG TPA: YafY family protein [Blastocatellia bacterium]|nr:YafY family protein [Blastocatellia bacterium]
MRADRLLSIMLLLQVHRRVTARELAARLEVSSRTIHRDMEALGMAGVPVVAERGTNGGWSLVEEYRTNLTGLSKDEAQALCLVQPARLLADLGLGKAADAALIKLLAALPAAQRDDAEYARQRIHVDLSGWHRTDESLACLPTIQQAVWQGRRLRLVYERGLRCEVVERVVDPLGLVAKGSAWYLVAASEGEARTYRVARVTKATLLEEVCERPKDFDLAAYWQASTASFKANLPRYQARLRVAPEVLPRLGFAGRFARIEHTGQPEADGWSEVHVRFDVEEMAIEYALSFGPQVEVLAPAALRDKVIAMARRVIDFYAPPRAEAKALTRGSHER